MPSTINSFVLSFIRIRRGNGKDASASATNHVVRNRWMVVRMSRHHMALAIARRWRRHLAGAAQLLERVQVCAGCRRAGGGACASEQRENEQPPQQYRLVVTFLPTACSPAQTMRDEKSRGASRGRLNISSYHVRRGRLLLTRSWGQRKLQVQQQQ